MAFKDINLVQCTDCSETMPRAISHDHDCPNDCPNDPMKDPVKRAEYAAWEKEFNRREAIWEAWGEDHPEVERAYASMGKEPHEIAINGRIVFFDPSDGCRGSKNYHSKAIVNPTWSDAMLAFEEAIQTVDRGDHIFLEGLVVNGKPPHWAVIRSPDITYVSFSTGS